MSSLGPRWPVVAGLTRFWADDKGLSVFSALLFIVTFVLPPLLPVTGPLYLAILIARLVSLAVVPGRRAGPDG
jgi:hypothetical protein